MPVHIFRSFLLAVTLAIAALKGPEKPCREKSAFGQFSSVLPSVAKIFKNRALCQA
jgi:hypothetical protein